MKNLALRWKILAVGLVPLVSFSILSIKEALHSYETYKDTRNTHSNMELLQGVSQAVHEIQIERGMTAGFLGGSIPLSELENQRHNTDEKTKFILDNISRTSLSNEYPEKVLDSINALKDIRTAASRKTKSTPEIISAYSNCITALLRGYIVTAEMTSLHGIDTALYSLAILEEAKESSGRLRANITGILSKNAPISNDQFFLLLNLKGKIDANITSPGLMVSKEVFRLLREFNETAEWQKVNGIFKIITTLASTGRYNIDPKEAFQTMTKSINYLSSTLRTQEKEVFEKLENIQSSSFRVFWFHCLCLSGAIVLLIGFTVHMVKSLSNSLHKIADRLVGGSGDLGSASESIAASSSELSESATEQAAALQQTVSSVDEISAMVNKNAEAAGKSREISVKSQEVTEQGKVTVDEMIQAINQIHHNNNETMIQMKQSNQEISEITKVISEIGNKTKVINDIVFQTKLLSFNASVEAARAGDHGKGFAVVAEEVGNLAQMSGNAAKEISGMLGESIRKVNQIVENTKTKMDRLVANGEEKIKVGITTANKCSESLNEIFKNVSTVNSIVNEIATASNEQAQGIQEITKALGQLDQVTQQNSTVAQQCSTAAEQLNHQAEGLKMIVEDLKMVLDSKLTKQQIKHTIRNSKPQNPVVTKTKTLPKPPKKTVKVSSNILQVPSSEDPRFEETD